MIERNMQKADMENEGKNAKQINRPEKIGLMKLSVLFSYSSYKMVNVNGVVFLFKIFINNNQIV